MRSSRTAKAFAIRSMQMLILASILLLTAVAAMAQATTGTLKGTVADANGAVVAGDAKGVWGWPLRARKLIEGWAGAVMRPTHVASALKMSFVFVLFICMLGVWPFPLTGQKVKSFRKGEKVERKARTQRLRDK